MDQLVWRTVCRSALGKSLFFLLHKSTVMFDLYVINYNIRFMPREAVEVPLAQDQLGSPGGTRPIPLEDTVLYVHGDLSPLCDHQMQSGWRQRLL
ncbi:hypothetical protein NHX12_001352 [Muraenolepis orangiensis]|uniref:Uncharacterized protein n=1 Tax=Muraenolepis orangiensis TaxID=630683 RepID=A0A9Q0IH50_9TELE|nr:hypothetical protein NHX12_001352 [Muraenolepis orangiensis]